MTFCKRSTSTCISDYGEQKQSDDGAEFLYAVTKAYRKRKDRGYQTARL